MKLRKSDIIILSLYLAIFIVALKNYLISPPYIMGDTAIFPIYNSPQISPQYTIIDLLYSIIGENNTIKALNLLAFLLGPFSIYFILRDDKNIIKRTVLPIIYTLNPLSVSIFFSGNGEDILFIYSLQPIVFYLTYKLLENKSLKYFALLSIVEIIGQIAFFQMFLFSFFFQLPVILIALRNKKYPFVIYPILADLLGFLSELSQEIYIYLNIVPDVLVSPSNTLTSLGLFYYSTIVSLLLITLGVTTFLVYKNIKSLTIISSIGFLLLIYSYVQLFHFYIPIVSALLAAITTFQTKVFLLSFGLLTLSLVYVKKNKELIPPLIFLILIVLLPNTGGLSVNTYSLFFVKPTTVPSWYFSLYNYLSHNDPYNLYSVTTSYSRCISSLPGFMGFLPNVTSFSSLYGIKYIVSSKALNLSSLRLVNKYGPLYLYYNNNYTGLVHYLNGTPINNYIISYTSIKIFGNINKPVVISMPYSKYWTNSLNYSNLLELSRNTSHNTLILLVNRLYYVSLVFFILPFVLLSFEGKSLIKR